MKGVVFFYFNTAGRNILDNLTPSTNNDRNLLRKHTQARVPVATYAPISQFVLHEGNQGREMLFVNRQLFLFLHIYIYRKFILSSLSEFSDDKLIGRVHIKIK